MPEPIIVPDHVRLSYEQAWRLLKLLRWFEEQEGVQTVADELTELCVLLSDKMEPNIIVDSRVCLASDGTQVGTVVGFGLTMHGNWDIGVTWEHGDTGWYGPSALLKLSDDDQS